jgi:aspartate/methionine/tyrosine aminotransferase
MAASTANFVALAAVAGAGDRVLIERPVYDPIVRAARFLGLEVVFFDRPADQGYFPDLGGIELGLGHGARAVVLTNLHNPSGLLCPERVLRQLSRLAAQYGAVLIADEVYLDYARLNSNCRPLRAAQLGEHVITTDSLTKVYGLGWLRAGWMIANPRILDQARHVIDLLNVVNPVISARLARQALDCLDTLAERCRTAHDRRYSILSAWLESRSDLGTYGHDGALFSWVRLPPGVSGNRLADLLAAEYDTTLVPGEFFGADGHVRIGFDLPEDELREGLQRVGAALDRLTRGQANPAPSDPRTET